MSLGLSAWARIRNTQQQHMKKLSAKLLIAGLLAILPSAIPGEIAGFSGKLTDRTGKPLEGLVNIIVKMYDAPTGGASKWTEAHTTVPLTGGIFRLDLGTITPLDRPTDQPWWITLTVGNDAEMSPRRPVPMPRGAALPRGTIVLWSGSPGSIPSGFSLCDGSNGAPDLRNRFVVGWSVNDQGIPKSTIDGTLAQLGGSATHVHTGTTDAAGIRSGGNWRLDDNSGGSDYNVVDPHSHTFTTNPGANIPPYFALAYIMKL